MTGKNVIMMISNASKDALDDVVNTIMNDELMTKSMGESITFRSTVLSVHNSGSKESSRNLSKD